MGAGKAGRVGLQAKVRGQGRGGGGTRWVQWVPVDAHVGLSCRAEGSGQARFAAGSCSPMEHVATGGLPAEGTGWRLGVVSPGYKRSVGINQPPLFQGCGGLPCASTTNQPRGFPPPTPWMESATGVTRSTLICFHGKRNMQACRAGEPHGGQEEHGTGQVSSRAGSSVPSDSAPCSELTSPPRLWALGSPFKQGEDKIFIEHLLCCARCLCPLGRCGSVQRTGQETGAQRRQSVGPRPPTRERQSH